MKMENQNQYEKVRNAKCFLCGSRTRRPYKRIPLIFPSGTESEVLVCGKCFEKFKCIIVEPGNPNVILIPILKH
jgi:hypothetical protein